MWLLPDSKKDWNLKSLAHQLEGLGKVYRQVDPEKEERYEQIPALQVIFSIMIIY